MAAKLKWKDLVIICAFCVALRSRGVGSSKDVVRSMTAGFSKVLEECKTEMNLQEGVVQEFYSFWREDFALVNREMGCVIMCMAAKVDMVTDDMKLHHENAHEFAKKHGADDGVAKQLVTMIHECESVPYPAAANDDCMRVLEIAKCFKVKIHGLKWAPTMEVVLEEVMTEV